MPGFLRRPVYESVYTEHHFHLNLLVKPKDNSSFNAGKENDLLKKKVGSFKLLAMNPGPY